MNLFIVESPKKIKEIKKILGKTYTGLSSYGHIMDLSRNKMSIDFDNNFEPTYEICEGKKKVVKELINASKGAKEIYLATDKDREGEMISWNIAHVLKLKNPKRIVFTSITKKALEESMKNVGTIDYNMVNSQKCRRILDRLVGFKLSPILDSFMNSHSLSAGRVQSVIAKLIVDRENEIYKFFSKNTINSKFQFDAIFDIDGENFKAQMFTKKPPLTVKPFKGDTSKIPTKDEATQTLTTMMESIFTIENVFTKKRTQSSPSPFTTSTLQQDASRKLSFNGKKTMAIAQTLYECGYITYMRTDAVILSEEALINIEKYILETYDKKYYKKTIYKSNDKAQEAHECIRPTDVFRTELEEDDRIHYDEIRLYKLVWKRTVASQMANAEFNDLNVQIAIDNLNMYYFTSCIASLVFDGFLILYKKDAEPIAKFTLDQFKVNTILNVLTIHAIQEYDRPPSRYNDASLTCKLGQDELNIGRPATTADNIQRIITQNYVKIADSPGKQFNAISLTYSKDNQQITEKSKIITLSKDTKVFMPTKLGTVITNYLTLYFSKIMDYQFTTDMEKKLDDIASGKLVWYDVVKEFYDDFHPLVMARVNVNNLNKIANQRLLGQYENKDIYATTTKYGPCIKYLDGLNVKFLKIVEPFKVDTITLDEAKDIIDNNSGYPKMIGLWNRKKIILKKGNDSYYIAYDKKTYTSPQQNLTLNEAINLIQSDKRHPLKKITFKQKTCSVFQGKENKFLHIEDIKTKKSYNVPLPDGEDIDKLDVDRINVIVNNAYNKNKNKTKK
jgi:DNA topoisomerase I